MAELTSHHRDALASLFERPTAHNLEWPDALALLNAVGSVEERHNGKKKVTIGEQTIVVSRSNKKDVDEDTVVLLRHLLAEAGFGAQ